MPSALALKLVTEPGGPTLLVTKRVFWRGCAAAAAASAFITLCSPARTRWLAGSSFSAPASMASPEAVGEVRRSTAWIRASSSRGLKGLVT